MIEGPRSLMAAMDAGLALEAVFASPGSGSHGPPDAVIARARHLGIPVVDLAPGVMERVASTVSPQAVMGVAAIPASDPVSLARLPSLTICIDVQDPGNLGALVRSAEASGMGAVFCSETCCDLYNPKVVRASAGAMFRIPVLEGGASEVVLEQAGAAGFRRLAAVARGGTAYTEADLSGRVALVLGNEAAGLPAGLAEGLEEKITIPMAPGAQSLNVAMAATVLCFEAARQRRSTAQRERQLSETGTCPGTEQPTLARMDPHRTDG